MLFLWCNLPINSDIMHQMATFIVILYIIPFYLNRLIILFLNSNLPEPYLNFVYLGKGSTHKQHDQKWEKNKSDWKTFCSNGPFGHYWQTCLALPSMPFSSTICKCAIIPATNGFCSTDSCVSWPLYHENELTVHYSSMCCIPRVDSNNVNQCGAQMWAVGLKMSNTVLRFEMWTIVLPQLKC